MNDIAKMEIEGNSLSDALERRKKDFNFRKATVGWSIVITFCAIGAMMGYVVYIFLAVGAVAGLVWTIRTRREVDEYLASEEFTKIKRSILKNTKDINELNQHIKELKSIYVHERAVSQGRSELSSGGYNFKRAGWEYLTNDNNVHHCSLQTVKNSKVQPFKYICKYFDIKPNQENLEKLESIFNNYAAAEQGQVLLLRERSEIFAKISEKIPAKLTKYVPNKLVQELGFDPVDRAGISFPRYAFTYVSAGGNSMAENVVVMDLDNLEGFIKYLNTQIKWRKSIAGQRALMTAALRDKIKSRDRYTCRKCGASVAKEPNLLLEVDHIMPLARGGDSTESNLQTLCWRCNRKKGAKIEG